jgi:DNA uptake protein ComE-like DNA-binding protein
LVNILAESYGWLDKISAVMTGDWGHFGEIINRQAQAKTGATELGAAWRALAGADPGTEQLWQRQILLNKSMADGIKQAGGLKQALDLLNGGALSAREAERSYQEAIDAVTASIRENGKTLNINTAEGRANQATLDALAQSGSNRAQSIYDQVYATRGQVAAEAAATAAYRQGREQLIRSAMQMGMTEEAARRLADEIMAIPTQWTTRVTLVGADSAIARANAVEAAVKRLTGKTIRVRVTGGRGGNLEGFAGGGPILGPGPKGVDSKAIMAAPGEHMLTAREVDAAGGHSAVAAWRKSLLTSPTSATAAPAQSARVVRAELEVSGEREIVALLRRLIKNYRLMEA